MIDRAVAAPQFGMHLTANSVSGSTVSMLTHVTHKVTHDVGSYASAVSMKARSLGKFPGSQSFENHTGL